jgi:hypothetical protein
MNKEEIKQLLKEIHTDENGLLLKIIIELLLDIREKKNDL